MTIGQKLIELRKAKKLSQQAVADALGVHVNSYARVERGINNLSKDMTKKLEELYGKDLSAFADGESTSKESDKKAEAPAKAAKAPSEKASSAPKKETKSAPSKKPTEPTINIELQYAGKAIPYDEIVKRAQEATSGKDNINIYIKPEENRVYYVSGDSVGSFEI